MTKTHTRTMFLVVALIAGLTVLAPAASAAPLTGSTWCVDGRDSLTVIGGSTSTELLQPDYSSPDGTYDPTEFGWYSRLTKLAASAWGTVSTNHSRNGARAASFDPNAAPNISWPVTRNAMDKVNTQQPDLTIIAVGTNEYLSGAVSPDQFQAELTALVDRIKVASPRTAILLVTQHTVSMPATHPYTWGQFATRIYNVAVAEQTAMVDLRQHVPSVPYGGVDKAIMFSKTYYNGAAPGGDMIHLSPPGHSVMMSAMWTWLLSC